MLSDSASATRSKSSDYIGRFAPSPTGPLHLGSLYTALASYLDAKYHHGKWLVRIEDIDPPREQAGATELILQTLQAHGLHWDDEVLFQSQRAERYESILTQLQHQQQCFACRCSRKDLSPYGEFYPGTCRTKPWPEDTKDVAIRLKVDEAETVFDDRLLGLQQEVTAPNGMYHDFVIKRRDQLYAYQLAVVVDDIDQGVTHIVRGNDILDSTFRQIHLYHYLQIEPPVYLHLPTINHADGQKLSKQNHASAIDNSKAIDNLLQALQLLQQTPPALGASNSVAAILDWAITHWNISKIPAQAGISPCLPAGIE